MNIDISHIRREYRESVLHKSLVSPDPIEQFTLWLSDALKSKLTEPTAMVLSTVINNMPNSRVVLLKDVSQQGFAFFTNYASAKGKELAENPNASLVFFWAELERQVRVQGTVEKLPEIESDQYFSTRPVGSKIGAWASPQSSEIESRKKLEILQSDFESKYGDEEEIPRPPNWGGYRLKPLRIEFWQGRPSRLHDRIEYTLENGVWTIRRLAP